MTIPRRLTPLLILGLAFGLRLYRLDFQSLWWDEGHSIFVAAHPIADIPTLPAMDVHPPAYFALLHGWQIVAGHSEFALRYLSLIFSLLTVALLWRLTGTLSATGKRSPISHHLAASLTGLLAALSPLYVAYAQEVRSYAMLTCLAVGSTGLLWEIIRRSDINWRQIWPQGVGYVLLTVACLYTHYFSIFLLLFQNIGWLTWALIGWPRTSKRRASLWLSSQVAILFLFAPQLRLASQQVADYANPNLEPPSLSHFVSHSWQAYTVGLTVESTLAWWGMVIVAALCLMAGLALSWHNRPAVSFLIAWFLIPLMAYYLVLQIRPSFEPRYLILVTPAMWLLLGLGLSHLPQQLLNRSHQARLATPQLTVLFSLPLVIIFTLSLHSYYTNEAFFKDNSAGVVDWLAGETTTNDIIYVDVPHPFHYYRDRLAAPLHYLFVDIHTAAQTLNRQADGRARLFWITWRGSDTDPRGVIPFLLQKQGPRLGQQDFRGYRVQWFRLSGEPFSLPNDLPAIEATFGDLLRLDGAAFGQGATVWATLHFQLLRETEVDYKVSVRLRSPAGEVVAQTDSHLLNDRHFRTSAWPLDDPALNQATNVYLLFPPADMSPGRYRLEGVVYNAEPPYPSEGVTGPASFEGTVAVLGEVVMGRGD